MIWKRIIAGIRAGEESDNKPTYEEIDLRKCFHYLGCHYSARFGVNPYLDYVLDIAEGRDVARRNFLKTILSHRPRTLNEAYDLKLDVDYPLWHYPWQNDELKSGYGWLNDPDNCPDILTFYSEGGVLSHRVEQEFYWLERAFKTISIEGYRPDQFGYIKVIEFRCNELSSTYLVADGNHRIASMVAAGILVAKVEVIKIIDIDDIFIWPGVASGVYTKNDSQKIYSYMLNPNKKIKCTAATIGKIECDYRVSDSLISKFS